MKKGGLLTVYTDNLWYGKLLCRQLGSSIGTSCFSSVNSNDIIPTMKEKKKKNKNHVQHQINTTTTTTTTTAAVGNQCNDNKLGMHSLTMEYIKRHHFEGYWEEVFSCQGVILFKGSPGKECGHMVEASSYFDRLWKLDNRSDRYMIVLQK